MKLSLALLLGLVVQLVYGQHPLRVVFNGGGELGRQHSTYDSNSLTCPSTEEDPALSCTPKEMNLINSAFGHHRNLQFGPYDVPCLDQCEGWPPGYCFYYFCELLDRHRNLNSVVTATKATSNDRTCMDTVANLDSHFEENCESLSQPCKELVASREFTCLA